MADYEHAPATLESVLRPITTKPWIISAYHDANLGLPFSIDGKYHIYIGASEDGIHWKLLTQSEADSIGDPATSVGTRDMTICRWAGWYWGMCPLDGMGTQKFVLRKSRDLLTWSSVGEVIDVTDSLPGTSICYSAEWFVGTDGPHLMIPVDTAGNANTWRIYETHPTNAAMTTWSSLVKLTVPDLGQAAAGNGYDPFIIRVNGVYYLFTQCGSDTVVYSSSSLTGTYTAIRTGDWATWNAQ